MLFEVHSTGRGKWFVRHILTQNDAMGHKGALHTRAQAKLYATLLETSPFIWQFTDPAHVYVLNDKKTLHDFINESREIALGAK